MTRARVLEGSRVSTPTRGRRRWFSNEMGSRGETRACGELVRCMIQGEVGEAGLATARSMLPWPTSPTVLLLLLFLFKMMLFLGVIFKLIFFFFKRAF
jgi:hypothetical protein